MTNGAYVRSDIEIGQGRGGETNMRWTIQMTLSLSLSLSLSVSTQWAAEYGLEWASSDVDDSWRETTCACICVSSGTTHCCCCCRGSRRRRRRRRCTMTLTHRAAGGFSRPACPIFSAGISSSFHTAATRTKYINLSLPPKYSAVRACVRQGQGRKGLHSSRQYLAGFYKRNLMTPF